MPRGESAFSPKLPQGTLKPWGLDTGENLPPHLQKFYSIASYFLKTILIPPSSLG